MAARYHHNGLVLVRSTTDPGDLDIPWHCDLANDDAAAGDGRAWLEKLWAREDVRAALTLASPALCDQLDKCLADSPHSVRGEDIRRVLQSVAPTSLATAAARSPPAIASTSASDAGMAALMPALDTILPSTT